MSGTKYGSTDSESDAMERGVNMSASVYTEFTSLNRTSTVRAFFRAPASHVLSIGTGFGLAWVSHYIFLTYHLLEYCSDGSKTCRVKTTSPLPHIGVFIVATAMAYSFYYCLIKRLDHKDRTESPCWQPCVLRY